MMSNYSIRSHGLRGNVFSDAPRLCRSTSAHDAERQRPTFPRRAWERVVLKSPLKKGDLGGCFCITSLVLALVLLMLPITSFAQSLTPPTNWLTTDYLAEADEFSANEDIVLSSSANEKSPQKAFIMSAILPGSGELYAGQKRGLIHTAAEIGLWAGFFIYTKKAEDKRIEYEAYADDHWDFYRWGNWYAGSNWDSIGSETFYTHADGTPVKDHHYYEKLGKYPWAQGGWDDFPADDPNFVEGEDYSLNHLAYLDMRQDKNGFNSTATLCASVAIANHVISAFHAALSARSHNRKLTEHRTKLKFSTHNFAFAPEVRVSLVRTF